jgi:Gpi18-like mannosyltransferase
VTNGLLSTPRPVPGRRAPALAGAGVVVLALPVFLVAGFPLGGWALAAVLWLAGELLGIWLGRLPTGADHLPSSGLVGLAHAFRGIGVIVVLAVVTLANRDVGIAALAVYALAYSLSLGVSLVEYFGGEKLG